MNILKSNFTRNKSTISTFCINSCKKEIDNGHPVYCKELNGNSLIRYEDILNGSLQEKLETLWFIYPDVDPLNLYLDEQNCFDLKVYK